MHSCFNQVIYYWANIPITLYPFIFKGSVGVGGEQEPFDEQPFGELPPAVSPQTREDPPQTYDLMGRDPMDPDGGDGGDSEEEEEEEEEDGEFAEDSDDSDEGEVVVLDPDHVRFNIFSVLILI